MDGSGLPVDDSTPAGGFVSVWKDGRGREPARRPLKCSPMPARELLCCIHDETWAEESYGEERPRAVPERESELAVFSIRCPCQGT